MQKISTAIGLTIIIVLAVLMIGGVFIYQYFVTREVNNQSQTQSNQQNQNQPHEIVGGACSYDVIDGSCKIVSIAETPESKQQKSATGYEGFDVEFVFTPESSLAMPENVKKILISRKSPYSLQLTNSWYPGPFYLTKYNIKENNIFDCQAFVITKGTCSPVVFKFSKINLSDYFE